MQTKNTHTTKARCARPRATQDMSAVDYTEKRAPHKWYPCVVQAVGQEPNVLDMFVACSGTHLMLKRDCTVLHEKPVKFSVQNASLGQLQGGDNEGVRLHVGGTNFKVNIRMRSAPDRHELVALFFDAKDNLAV